MTQDVGVFDKIKQSGQWWLNPWWLKEDSKYVHIVGIILILSSYPVQYERRVIVNPYTKFGSIGENYAILLEEE